MSAEVRSVFVVDLLALSPFYDRYLVEALAKNVPTVRLYAAAFPYEPDYWQRTNVDRASGLLDRVAQLGISNKRLRRALQLIEYSYNWMKLLTDVRRESPTVVHLQWLPLLEFTELELWVTEEISRAGAAIVYTAHNALPHDSPREPHSRYRRLYDSVDGVLVHTERERMRLANGLGVDPTRIEVVRHGPMLHDLATVERGDARLRLGISMEDEVVLFVGLLRPYKGIEDLLQAIANLVLRRPNVRLLLAGQGEAAFVETVHAAVDALGLAAHVTLLTRYIPVDEMPVLYGAADVTVLPYRAASQSGALFTAAAFDVPLVATTVGGLGEALADTERARLVPPNDPSALANEIASLLAVPEPERRALAGRLRDWARAECSWDGIARETVRGYERALSRRRNRS